MLSLFTLSPNRRKQSRSSVGGRREDGGGGGGGSNSSDEKYSLSRKSSQAESSNSGESEQVVLSQRTKDRQTIPATPSPSPHRHRDISKSDPAAFPLSPPGSDTKKRATFESKPTGLNEGLDLGWRFAKTSIPLVDANWNSVKWGLLNERNDVTLGLEDLGVLVQTICAELSKRGLEIPLLFSSLAVNLSCQKIRSLIQTYVASVQSATDWTIQRPTPQEKAWAQDILLSDERELAWVLRWALTRALQIREGNEEKRGLADLDQYIEWRKSERAADYPQTHIFAFAAKLGTLVQPIFIDLLTFFSKLVAHSNLSGCTPPVISGLFGPILFGLPVTSTFVETHKHFVKSALATEHLLLSFIRSQSFASLQKSLPLPLRLQSWVKNYPAMLVSDRVWLSGDPRKDGKFVRSELIRKDVRAYSTELFRTAGSWINQLEREFNENEVLDTWVNKVVVPSKTKAGLVLPSKGPRFASDYKKRLNIQSTALSSYRAMSHRYLYALATGEADDDEWDADEDEEGAGWETLAEKRWGSFAQGGFGSVGESTERSFGLRQAGDPINGRLQFDLTEGSIARKRAEKRASITWTDFSNTGFPDTGITLSDPLDLFLPIQKEISSWPEHREQVYQRLETLQQDLPTFDYDIRPRVCEPVRMEEAFVDAWADLFLGAGWTNRVDPTARECNWAIVQYKVIDRREGSTKPNTLYVVFEENVPAEYQHRLVDPPPKKQMNFKLFKPKSMKQKKPNKGLVRPHQGGNGELDPTVWRGRSSRQLSVFQKSYSTNLDDRVILSRSRSSTSIGRSGSGSGTRPRARTMHGSRSEPSLVNVKKGMVKSYEIAKESPKKGEDGEGDARRKTAMAMMTREALVKDKIDRSMYASKERVPDPARGPIGSCTDTVRTIVQVPNERPEPGLQFGPVCFPAPPVGRPRADSEAIGPNGRSTRTAGMVPVGTSCVQRDLLRADGSSAGGGRRQAGAEDAVGLGSDRPRLDGKLPGNSPRPDVQTEGQVRSNDSSLGEDEDENQVITLGAPLEVCTSDTGNTKLREVVPVQRSPVVSHLMPGTMVMAVPMSSGETRLTRSQEGSPGLGRMTVGEGQDAGGLKDLFVAPVSTYVHGQPLHNLLEEEEEEEEEEEDDEEDEDEDEDEEDW